MLVIIIVAMSFSYRMYSRDPETAVLGMFTTELWGEKIILCKLGFLAANSLNYFVFFFNLFY